MLFEGGKNAKQVQTWLGHHSPSFTVDTYVHLLRDGPGEPLRLSAELNGWQSTISPSVDATGRWNGLQ
jgi:hypothetical protein